MVSRRVLEKIKEFEGYQMKAYKCPAGVWTCGYGHTQGVDKTTTCTRSTAERWLLDDLSAVETVVNNIELVLVGLTDGQRDALTSFIFNIGSARFYNSTLWKVMKTNSKSKVLKDLWLQWRYSNGRELKGLVNRRKWEVGVYYES